MQQYRNFHKRRNSIGSSNGSDASDDQWKLTICHNVPIENQYFSKHTNYISLFNTTYQWYLSNYQFLLKYWVWFYRLDLNKVWKKKLFFYKLSSVQKIWCVFCLNLIYKKCCICILWLFISFFTKLMFIFFVVLCI